MNDIIADTTPSNILEEKAKFFASDTYQPQFVYARPLSPTELTIWGLPQKHFFEYAQQMLSQHIPEAAGEEYSVDEKTVIDTITNFNQKYQLNPALAVQFSDQFVARCRVTENSILFQRPLRYTSSKFADLMRHELETHMLRRLNHQKQPWAHTIIPDQEFRKTEEGLAGLHTHLLRKNKIVRKSHLTYSAVYLAQQTSFRDVFNAVRSWGVSPATAWLITLRTKRGLTDTSLPGGLTKDLCYLEGMVEVWHWLQNRTNDPHHLYLGRISLKQIDELKQQAITTGLVYPSFFDTMDTYLANIQAIGEVNNFNDLT